MSKSDKHVLDKELEFYNQHKQEYLKSHFGQFVVVGETEGKAEFAGAFPTPQQAYEAGLQRFGLFPFLIRHVGSEDETLTLPAYTLGLLSA